MQVLTQFTQLNFKDDRTKLLLNRNNMVVDNEDHKFNVHKYNLLFAQMM